MAYLKLDPEDIKAIAQEIRDMLKPEEKEDDILFLKDLAEQHRCSYSTLNRQRREKFIPKVEGIREVAIYRKYLPQLKLSKAS